MVKFDFIKMQQTSSLPYIRSKFFATFFSTMITAMVNIARNSNGLIYMLCKTMFSHMTSTTDTSGILWMAMKNIAGIFVRCVDVTVNVILIFGISYFIIRVIQQHIYSKRFKKRREYLKRLLWENIVPNILEISEKEKEMIIKKHQLSCIEKKQWCIALASILKIHSEIIFMINKEGIFEYIYNQNSISKYYKEYLKDINFPLIYVIFQEEESLLCQVCAIIKDVSQHTSDEAYQKLLEQYKNISQEYHNIINTMNTNK